MELMITSPNRVELLTGLHPHSTLSGVSLNEAHFRQVQDFSASPDTSGRPPVDTPVRECSLVHVKTSRFDENCGVTEEHCHSEVKTTDVCSSTSDTVVMKEHTDFAQMGTSQGYLLTPGSLGSTGGPAEGSAGHESCDAKNEEKGSERVSVDGNGNTSTEPGSCILPKYTPCKDFSASSEGVHHLSAFQSPYSESSSTATESSGALDEEGDTEDCESRLFCRPGLKLVDGKQISNLSPENVVLCINAGGALISSTSFGVDFLEDTYFLGGDVLRTGENISNTMEPLVYQTARYGNFSYNIHDLPPGDYLVDLHFAEIIFTNGPPGMRIFDVFVQREKVAAKLDVYSKVGSNTPLILLDARAPVRDHGLSISFRGIVGSPTISGICVRRAPPLGLIDIIPNQLESEMGLQKSKPAEEQAENFDITKIQYDHLDGGEPAHMQMLKDQTRRQKIKSKARKCVREYEMKIEELKNEIHHAWMSVQDSNRQNDKLRSELDCKSIHVDSLAQAVEVQLNEMKDLKDKAESEKKKWMTSVLDMAMNLQVLKGDYALLVNEAREWVSSFPEIHNMTGKVQDLVNEHDKLKEKFVEESQNRRKFYNQVLELKGNIRVFCRCRPLSMTDLSAGASSVVEFDAARDNELVVRPNGANKKVFKFDRVFTPSDNQVDVFVDTAPVVVSVLDGYNVCIFAYGQTGTGKTFTMEGTETNRGVNYRTLEELFHVASERMGQYEYSISVSVVEVYNEQIRDLLASPPTSGQTAKKLEIKQVAEGVHHVPGLTEARVHCMEEVWEVLQTGSSARAVGSTNANEHSSRSHCMLCVMVKGQNLLTGECTRSKLWLVDLAGSERVAKTDVQGERLKEAQSINRSLSALGDVIYALTTKSSHIPYRNSKLTHLLQDSLGGESKTLMFVQISPSEQDVGETLCSLNFASRVRGVELGPARKQLDSSELVKYKQLIEKSKQDGRLKEDSIKKMEDTLKMKEQTCRALSDKVRDAEGQLAAERKARSTAESKLKEQQLLIERLTEQLKCTAKDSLNLPDPAHRRPLRENLKENSARLMEAEKRCSVDPDDNSCPQKENAGETADLSFPGKLKVVPSRYNSSPTLKILSRRPGRASLCGMPRRPSMAPLPVPLKFETVDFRSSSESLQESLKDENLPASKPSLAPGIFATRRPGRASICGVPRRPSLAPLPVPLKLENVDIASSTESLQESLKDENLPAPKPSIVPTIFEVGTPKAWRGSIAPNSINSILRRSIPRKIHFRSPHLQPNFQQRTADRQLELHKKREQDQSEGGERQGVSKMRRVSMAATLGKTPQQQLWTASGTTGGAQRVLLTANPPIAGKPTMHTRERGWNR